MKNIHYAAVLFLIFIENTNGFVCTSDGLLANPSNTHTYYQCSSGVAYLMQCPSGLVWHEDKRRCDWKKEERKFLGSSLYGAP